MSSYDLASRLKIAIYLLVWEIVLQSLPVLDELPTSRQDIKVPQGLF